MNENKKSEGKEFKERLANADNKSKLVELARDSIIHSHDKRAFSERKELITASGGLHLRSVYALGRSETPEFSTNDRLYMIMYKYMMMSVKNNPLASDSAKEKAIIQFKKDFAEKYPQEYGIKSNVQTKQIDKSAEKPAQIMLKNNMQTTRFNNI